MNCFTVRLFVNLLLVWTCFNQIYSSEQADDEINRIEEENDEENEFNTIITDLRLIFNGNSVEGRPGAHSTNCTFIGWLRHKYFDLEDVLWSEIDYHSHKDEDVDLVQMVHFSHFIFFNGDFRENVVHLNRFNGYDKVYNNSVRTVNRFVDLAKSTYLNNPELIKDELRTLSIVQDQFELKKTLDIIFELITSNRKYFQSVSCYTSLRHFKSLSST